MPVQIVPGGALDMAPLVGAHTSREALLSLIRAHLTATCKRRGGRLLPLDPAEDAVSVWFSKEEIDQLFRDNGYSAGNGNRADYGLRIYFGLHAESREQYLSMPGRPAHYLQQHTAILVVTRDGEDLLHPGAHVSLYQPGGELNGSFKDEGAWEETPLLAEL